MSNQPDITPQPRPIWAPWRVEYIRSSKEKACFLCKNATLDRSDAHVVARGNAAYVLLNQYPYNAGHLLVAPVRHAGDLDTLSADERNEIMELVVQSTQALRRVMKPEGFNVGFNLGDAAGAGLAEHIHCHVVPRWAGDTNFMPVLSGTNVVPEALEQTAQLIKEAWS